MIRKTISQIMAVLVCCATGNLYADDIFEDFNAWGWLPSVGTYTNSADWVIQDGMVRTTNYTGIGGEAAWLTNTDDEPYTNTHVRTPLLTNGAGAMSFDTATYGTDSGADVVFQIQSSTNKLGPWTTHATLTNTAAALEWHSWSVEITPPFYTNRYLRITKPRSGNNMFLGVDNVHITEAPAKVDLGTPYSDPGEPLVGEAAHVFCTITPSALATITSTRLIYEIDGTYTTNQMVNVSNFLYQTSNAIPAQSTSGITVDYQVYVTLTGTNALSPATVTSFYTIAAKPFESNYNTMETIGAATAEMALISNHLWRGIATIPSDTNNAAFQFRGVHTNGATTNLWGDSSPASTALIVHGAASLSNNAITIDTMPTGTYGFRFNETNGAYLINSATFNDFDDWSSADTEGDHTWNGWFVHDGWVSADALRKRGTRSCYLSADGGAYVRTPEIASGIGEISFWMRHWETNATPNTECHLQVSETGSTNLTDWTTIATFPVNSRDFHRFTVPWNNRYDRYARILNTTGTPKAKLAIDEFMVMGPGAGVTLSNLTHSPASPTYSEPVSVSVELTSHRGATVTNMTAYWRSGDSGPFTAISMSADGNTWTADSDIPAGMGDSASGLGGGDVQYYVESVFTGYDAERASPTTTPRAGATSPDSYTIQSARMSYTNVRHTPEAPQANAAFSVEADIIPAAGATSPFVTLYYRQGATGGFSSLTMTNAGSNHFVSEGTVPMPSTPGTPMFYYLQTTFSGPTAVSPTNYPAGGPNDPVNVITRAPPPASAYTNMTIEGDFNTSLRLIDDYAWRGIVATGGAVDPAFRFKATAAGNTNVWYDNDVTAGTLPLFGTASSNDTTDIGISGTYTNTLVVYFNETNQHYRVQACIHQDYENFPLIDPPETNTTSIGNWQISSATIFTNHAFEGQSAGLGGASSNDWSHTGSTSITGGCGNISFWYRNLDNTGTKPGILHVQVNESDTPQTWETVATLTNIITADYMYYELPYANASNALRARILWDTADNPDTPTIGIDNVTIEQLGPYVTVSNRTTDPGAPTIASNVTIMADIAPLHSATNISATAWYRIGTNGTFYAADMVNPGGHHYETDPPLPSGEAGVMQYYLEIAFTDPYGSPPRYAYAPGGATPIPASFTNSDAFAAETDFESSEGWNHMFYIEAQTNNNWILSDGAIRNQGYDGRPFEPEAAWLSNTENDPSSNSFLRAPLCANGIGVLSFKAFNRDPEEITLLVQTSPNGVTDWNTANSFVSSNTTWTSNMVPIHLETSTYVRVLKQEQSSSHVGLDEVRLTYPLARVSISNAVFHPLYPSDTDTVHIECDIASIGTFAPAMDIAAEVYYKQSTTNTFSGPITMTRNGNHFQTATPIPAHASGRVDYYISSTFDGYSRLTSYSPTTSPLNATNTTHSYDVRMHESSYGSFDIVTEFGNSEMTQLRDGVWLGVAYYEDPATNTELTLAGLQYFDGTNEVAGVSFGDSNLTRTNLPYSGTMQVNGGNITLYGQVLGQYIIVYDERTGEYTVRRGVYQDFNNWPANNTYFDSSSGGTKFDQYLTDFDNPTNWPKSSPYITEEYFRTPLIPLNWTPTDNYPPLVTYSNIIYGANDSEDFAIIKGLVIPQLTAVGQDDAAALLHDQPVADANLRMNVNYTEGAGTLSFEARCVNNDLGLATYGGDGTFDNIRVQASMNASAIPINSIETTCGQCYVSIIGRYVDANNYYELRMDQRRSQSDGKYYRRLELWKKLGGTYTRLGGDDGIGGDYITAAKTFSLHIWTDANSRARIKAFDGSTQRISYLDNSPIADGGIGLGGLDADISVNEVRVYETTNENYSSSTQLYWEDFGDGQAQGWTASSAWTVQDARYRRPGYTGAPLEFTIDYTTGNPESDLGWTTLATYTNLNSTPYVSYSHEINKPENMFLRIRHSGGVGNLVLDNVEIDAWHGDTFEAEDWKAEPAWIDHNSYPRGDTTVHSNVVELLRSRALPSEDQYVRAPYSTNGAATIEFDYVSMTGTDNELVFSIDYTLDGDTNSWATDITVTNNPASFTHFAHTLSVSTNPYPLYVRIANRSADTDAGIAIDNLVVTPPVELSDNIWRGYNTLVTGLQTNKLLLEPDNLKGCYLNNAVDSNTLDGAVFDSDNPYVETSILPDGAGEVSFWYRAWDTNATRIDILAATNRFLPENQWTVLHTMEDITNQTYQYFSEDFYDPNARFVRLRCSTNPSVERVCLDNLLVAAPMASGLRIRNVELIPEIPLNGEAVYLKAEVYEKFLSPSNLVIKTRYQTGLDDWGNFTNASERGMALIEDHGTSQVYQTIIPLGDYNGHPTDTIMQYCIQAEFDGLFSSISSPYQQRDFTNPDWYWPINHNDGKTYATPYYVVLSCLPGQVWINEFNVADDILFGTTVTQYIELVGISGADIGNWKVQVIDTDYTTNAEYNVASSAHLGGTDYGFYLLGDDNVTAPDVDLTNTLPESGGIQLVRTMGAVESAVSYDTGTTGPGLQMAQNDDYRYVYAGCEKTFIDSFPLALTDGDGSGGSNATAFTWSSTAAEFTPGSTNWNQTLLPWTTNATPDSYDGALAIESFWTNNARIYMVVDAATNGLTLTPWYSTNLISGDWIPGANSGQSNALPYTVWCDLHTNAPGAFYKVTTE